MQRCSETIGLIAGPRWPRPQIELANPEKVADRDYPLFPSQGKVTAASAMPLFSSGLDLVAQVAGAGMRLPPTTSIDEGRRA